MVHRRGQSVEIPPNEGSGSRLGHPTGGRTHAGSGEDEHVKFLRTRVGGGSCGGAVFFC
jgi:hypothetical protein